MMSEPIARWVSIERSGVSTRVRPSGPRSAAPASSIMVPGSEKI